MKGALDIHRELLGREIPHEIVRLPRAILAGDELPDLLGVDAYDCMTVRIYVAGKSAVAVGLPAGASLHPEELLRALGTRTIRVATSQEINQLTDYAAGLVAPLLLPPTVPLFVDAALGHGGTVYTPTGETGTALRIGTADLLRLSGARVADLSTPSLVDMVVTLEV